MNYLGIDVHKRESHVAILDDDGEVDREIRVGVICERNECWSVGESTNRLLSLDFSCAEETVLCEYPNVTQITPAVRARFWYREFREIVLMFAVSNIEQVCESL